MKFSLFAKKCLLCHALCYEKLCESCLSDIRAGFLRADNSCPKCAQFSQNGEICARCRLYPPPYEKLWGCAAYAYPFKGILHEWKHLNQTQLFEIFSILLKENSPPWLSEVDSVLAMPVSTRRRLWRGFNQCDELAQLITSYFKIEHLSHQTVFRQHKPPQSSLGAQQRERNILDVFRVVGDVKNRKVLIIDDVMTTGATLTELSRTLQQSGAAAVFGCVVLRNF